MIAEDTDSGKYDISEDNMFKDCLGTPKEKASEEISRLRNLVLDKEYQKTVLQHENTNFQKQADGLKKEIEENEKKHNEDIVEVAEKAAKGTAEYLNKINKVKMEIVEAQHKSDLKMVLLGKDAEYRSVNSKTSECFSCLRIKENMPGILFVAVLAGALIHYLYQVVQTKIAKKENLKLVDLS